MKKLLLPLLCFCALTESNLSAQTWHASGTGSGTLQTSKGFTKLVAGGSGNIYATGQFTDVNGKYYVAKWDGTSWSEVGGLGSTTLGASSELRSLAADASGNVFVSVADHVMKWNGTAWVDMGSPVPSSGLQHIVSLATDASGNLYAGASFFISASALQLSVYKLTGTAWSTIADVNPGTILSGYSFGVIYNITVSANGTVYLASDIKNTTGQYQITKVNGGTLAVVGALNANQNTQTLTTDGSNNLYVTGYFTNANNKAYVAKWDGTSWTELGTGSASLAANNTISAITTDAAGNVYAAGYFTNNNGKKYVAKWNGTAWSELGSINADSNIAAVAISSTGTPYAAGDFTNTAGKKYVAQYSVAPPQAVNSVEDDRKVTIYPNPATGMTTVTAQLPGVKSLAVYNAVGAKVYDQQVTTPSGDFTERLDMTQQPAGVYFIRIETAVGSVSKKLVKE